MISDTVCGSHLNVFNSVFRITSPTLQRGIYLKDLTLVITLTLLHPLQSVPVQSWTFESESIIRIGRSTDNNVILYSAVVSRHHVEIRLNDSGWQVVSLGANGTYLEGKRITQLPVVDGMVIRLASSGPKIQIRIGSIQSEGKLNTSSGKPLAVPEQNEPVKKTFVDVTATDQEDRTAADLGVSAPWWREGSTTPPKS